MTLNLHSALVALLPRLHRFGLSLTGSVQEGEELVQAACARILAQAARQRAKPRLDTWAFTLMRSIWESEAGLRDDAQHTNMHAARNLPGIDGEKAMDGVFTLAAVRQSLNQLPAEQRTVLVLICIDGLSYQQAADVLGIPIGTVLSRIARGRESLRQRFVQPGDGRMSRLILPTESDP